MLILGLCVTSNDKPVSSARQRPHKASGEEMTKYHSDDYIKFLRSIRPDNMSEYSKQMQRCKFSAATAKFTKTSSNCTGCDGSWFILPVTVNVGEDCPVFDGLFEFCQLSGGGSVGELFFKQQLQWWRCCCFSFLFHSSTKKLKTNQGLNFVNFIVYFFIKICW